MEKLPFYNGITDKEGYCKYLIKYYEWLYKKIECKR